MHTTLRNYTGWEVDVLVVIIIVVWKSHIRVTKDPVYYNIVSIIQ